MNTVNELIKKQVQLELKYLSDYADFLLQNKLEEFAKAMIKVSKEEKLPVWKHFETMSAEHVTKISLETSNEILSYLAQNKAQEYIDIHQKRWNENRLPYLLENESFATEDIVLLAFIRRKVFRSFLADFTSDFNQWFEIMEELDRFTTIQQEVSIQNLLEYDRNKLRDHLLFFEKINKTVPGIIYVFDIEKFNPIYVSANREKLLGFAEDEVRGLKIDFWLSRYHPDDYNNVISHLRGFENAVENEVRALEYRVRNSKDEYQWFRRYDAVFKNNAEGVPVQIIGISIDITKEKETIFELENRNQQFFEAQEIAGFGTFDWDLQGSDSNFSTQMMKIFDLDETSNLPDFLEFVHPADQAIFKKAISNAMSENGVYECQYRYKRKQAKVIWSRGIVTFESEKAVRMRGFVMDVTKNYLLSEMLTESETTFRQLIQNAPDAIMVIDEKGNIVFWNPKAESVFGWKSDEIVGQTLFGTVLSSNKNKEKLTDIKWWKAYGQNNVNKTIEVTARSKKGKEFVIALSIAASLWNGKQSFITFVRNISKEKKIEKELEQNRNQMAQKNAELEKINTELTSFNYIASHDLKEPLRKIKTYSNFIIERSDSALSEDVQEYLKRIVTATTNMQKLIDDLLAFSRTSSTEKNLEVTDLNILLEEVKAAIKYSIDEHQATITSTKLPVVKIIPFQFQQLMENVIGNAIKYRKAGVPPVISITCDLVSGQDFISEGGIPEVEYNRISVKDNGIGFNQVYAHKIFEIFQRLHGKNEYSGTGIGLAICKKIVENHKGIITANSVEGEGATFHIFLPTKCPDSIRKKKRN